MNRLFRVAASATLLFASFASATVEVDTKHGIDMPEEEMYGKERKLDDPTVVGLVLDISGGVDSGFDKGGRNRVARRRSRAVCYRKRKFSANTNVFLE